MFKAGAGIPGVLLLVGVGLEAVPHHAARAQQPPPFEALPTSPEEQTRAPGHDLAITETRAPEVLTIEAGLLRVHTRAERVGLRSRQAGEQRDIDEQALANYVQFLARQASRAPTPGVFDLSIPLIERPRPGIVLDIKPATQALRNALQSGRRVVKLPTLRVRRPESDTSPARYIPKDVSVETVLSRFETKYERYRDARNRAHNIRTAARRLHGAIIPAGETLSFNQRVGPRTPAHGFREATVIYKGELTDGVGGGVCQAASTLHAAAFFAGLEQVQYRPHSRPAGYVPMGLDATVVWPHQDLILRNPFSFPLLVLSTTKDGTHTVEIRGIRAPRQVEWEREWDGTRPFTSRTQVDPSLPPGSRNQIQRGIRGYTVTVIRTLEEGSRSWVERQTLVYPPVNEITSVGPGAANADVQGPSE